MFKWLDAGIYFKTQIKDKFWLGQYGGFEVIIMEDTSYVNTTKLCLDDGKKFKNWLANDSFKKLINALEDQLGHVASDSIHSVSSLSISYTAAGIPAEASNNGSLSVPVCK